MRFRKYISVALAIIFLMTGLLSYMPAQAAEGDPDFTVMRSLEKNTFSEGDTGRLTYRITPQGSIKMEQRGSADIVIVLDISLSMEGDKLTNAKTAINNFIDSISSQGKNDRIGLITFGYRTINTTALTTSYSTVKSRINDLKKSSLVDGTNFDDALKSANAMLDKSTKTNRYIVFVSDGNPNYYTSTQNVRKYVDRPYTKKENGKYYYSNWPNDTPEAYSEAKYQAELAGGNGYVLFTLGVGKSNEVDAAYLEQLAAVTGGKSYVSAIPQDLAVNFGKVSSEIKQSRISNIIIKDKLPEGISIAPGSPAILNSDGSMSIRVPDIVFEVQKGTPAPISVWVDLIFNKAGSYNLNQALVQHAALNGAQSQKSVNALNVTVRRVDAPPGMTISKTAGKDYIVEGESVELTYRIVPTGTFIETVRRTPADIVLVLDKSYSMRMEKNTGTKRLSWYHWDDTLYNINGINYMRNGGIEYIINDKKMDNAKTAANNFVDAIMNSGLNDRLAVVGFDSQVTRYSGLTSQYANVKQKISSISPRENISSYTGTNYEAALTEANSILASSTNSRYIVFLSDGMPTVYGSNSNFKSNSSSLPYSNARNKATETAAAGTILHAIGVGTEDEVDMDFLAELSALGGGKVYQSVDSSNLNEIFKNISDGILQQSISNLLIKEGLPASVEVEDSNVVKNGNTVSINLGNIVFEKSGGTPSPVEYKLKLKFNQPGTYVLSPVSTISYNGYDGVSKSENINSVTVHVQEGDYIISNLNAQLKPKSTGTGRQINVEWNHKEADHWQNIDYFILERSIDGGNFVQIGTVSNQTDLYIDTNIIKGGIYTYRITSMVKGRAYVGGVSNRVYVNMSALDAPTFSATPQTPTTGTVKVTINYPDAAVVKEYRIGETGEWRLYTGVLDISENVVIYARCSDQYGTASSVSSYAVNNIVKISITYTKNPQSEWTTSVLINVTITSKTKISEAGWAKGTKNAFNENNMSRLKLTGEEFSDGYQYTSSFRVKENGKYTIYAKDISNPAIKAFAELDISNILPRLE